jgi:membrane protease YdiL (CAAX protease family)
MTAALTSLEHPYRAALVIVTAVVALMGMYYFARPDAIGVFSPLRGWRRMTPGTRTPLMHFAASALLLGIGPVLVAHWIGGFSWHELGLGFGHWKRGAIWLAVGLPLAVLAGKIAAGQAGMRAVYPLDPTLAHTLRAFVPYALAGFLYYGAWEVLFRGVLLFGLATPFGPTNANVTQSALACTAHFGRAINETFAALPGSALFGVVALTTGSIWYAALIHWTVGMTTEWFALVR